MLSQLERALEKEFLTAVDTCIQLYKYRPSYFLQMLSSHGAVNTAIKLATATKMHEGFTKLWELKRLDLTVEAIIIRSPYNELFTKEVLNSATKRLKELGYNC